MSRLPCRGFTLIEVMITVAIVAILSAVALPSYTAYVQRSRVPAGLEALSTYFTRMEQRFQDTGSYANGAICGVTLPAASHYSLSCVLSPGGLGYTATATGSGPMAGYAFTIDHQGNRRTTAHPRGLPSTACWSIRGGQCDA